jgi:hypothetical protein
LVLRQRLYSRALEIDGRRRKGDAAFLLSALLFGCYRESGQGISPEHESLDDSQSAVLEYGTRFNEYPYLCLVDEAVVDGVKRELEAIGHAEFVEDVVKVIFHRLFADEKLLADFLVAETLSDELHDFFFAIAEKGFFAARAGF